MKQFISSQVNRNKKYMVQILGKMLNNKKQVHDALKNIYGLKTYQIKDFCNNLNIGFDCRISDLSQLYVIKLLRLVEKKNILVETSLKKDIHFNIRRLIEIKSHRGLKFIRKRSLLKK